MTAATATATATPWAREKVESLYLFMLREQSGATDSPTPRLVTAL